MNVVVSLTGVVMCSSSAEAVWTGLPGPWVDLSTFLKLALVPLAVLIWQLASLLVCQLPFPKLALPCPLPQQCLLCVHFCFFLWACRPPHDDHSLVSTSIRMRSHGIFSQCACVFHHPNPHAQSRIFSQCACVFHRRMDVACVHTRTRSHSSWLKLKVLVTKGVLGSARGLTSSDALICCQVFVLILMADETDPARGLIRSWWRIRSWWLWWSSSVTKYLRWACLAVSPHHHNNPTLCSYCCWILLLVGKWYSTLGLLHMLYWVLGCLSPCVVACTLRLTWPFLWSCGWSILYVSSVLLLHDSSSLSFSHLCACLWPDKERCTCLKEFLNLSFPVRKAGGSDLSISTAHSFFFFFFLAPFCLLLFCFCTSSRKEHDQPRLMAM